MTRCLYTSVTATVLLYFTPEDPGHSVLSDIAGSGHVRDANGVEGIHELCGSCEIMLISHRTETIRG